MNYNHDNLLEARDAAPTSPTSNPHPGNDPALNILLAALSEGALFIRVPTTLPHGPKAPPPTSTFTGSVAEQHVATEFDLGIACGPASQDLCVVRFISKSAMDGFLAENPALADSLITSGPGEFLVWCRIDGYYPAPISSWDHEWLAKGNLVMMPRVGLKILRTGPLVKLPFRKIIWPEPVASRLREEMLFALHGPTRLTTQDGRAIVNLPLFVRMYAEVWQLVFNPRSNQFTCFDPKIRRHRAQSEENIAAGLARLFRNSVSRDPEYSDVTFDTSPLGLKNLVELLKVMVSQPSAS